MAPYRARGARAAQPNADMPARSACAPPGFSRGMWADFHLQTSAGLQIRSRLRPTRNSDSPSIVRGSDLLSLSDKNNPINASHVRGKSH